MSNSEEINKHDHKDEILAINRQSKSDEGLENALAKGNKLGEYASSAAAIPLVLFAFFTKELAVFLALGIVAFAYVFGQSLSVYRFTKKKRHLAWVILGAVFTIYAIVDFILLAQGGFNPLWLRWWMA